MILPSVDFPAPFSPTKAWTVPWRMAIETSSRARVAPKDFPSPRTSRWTASPACIAVPRSATRSDVGLGHHAAVGQRRKRIDTRDRRAGPDGVDQVLRAEAALGRRHLHDGAE